MKPAFQFFTMISDPAPISINKAYITVRNKRIMTTEGKVYKDAVKDQIMQCIEERYPMEWGEAIDLVHKQGGKASLEIDMYVYTTNGSWKVGGGLTKAKKRKKKGSDVAVLTGGGSVISPYKKMDSTNYIKLLEDAVSQATGIDDSSNMFVSIAKHSINKGEGGVVAVTYRVYGPD